MCPKCSSAQRRTSFSTAPSSNAASALACTTSQSKNAASRTSATLTASAMPANRSRASSVSRNRLSLITANGAANVPRKFFAPNALCPFLTPHPAVQYRGRKSDHVERRAAADRDHEGMAIHAQRREPRDDLIEHGAVLGRLAARDHPGLPGERDAIGVACRVALELQGERGPCRGDATVDHDGDAVPARRLAQREHVGETGIIGIEDPAREHDWIFENNRNPLQDRIHHIAIISYRRPR